VQVHSMIERFSLESPIVVQGFFGER